MGKDIERIYKQSESQISTLSINANVGSYSEPQTSPAIKLTTMYIPCITYKHLKNRFCVPKKLPRIM